MLKKIKKVREMNKEKVLVALSGGVDSSVAASILVNGGYECIGCTMLLNESTNLIINKETRSAQKAAESLGIPFVILDFRKEFKAYVIDKFVNTYLQGMTPNPCVDCNKHLKFGLFYDKAKEMGCDYIATGHYARIRKEKGHYYLAESSNKKKDQTYFLYNLSEEILSKTLFSLGDMSKEEVREIARKINLPTAEKGESQDICFVPGGNYGKVIEDAIGGKLLSGDFIGPDGKRLGAHQGIANYTVGQRKGLGIAYKEPLFVKEISVEDNIIYLGTMSQMYKDEILIDDVNFINGKPDTDFNCLVRTRYHQPLQKCTVELYGNNQARIKFDVPQKALTLGQAAVLYTDNEIIIGGGTISMS